MLLFLSLKTKIDEMASSINKLSNGTITIDNVSTKDTSVQEL